MTEKTFFDILLLAPLEEELSEVFSVFPHQTDHSENGHVVFEVDTGNSEITMLVANIPDFGKQEAARRTRELLGKYSFGLITCIGIAGRLSTDLKLGDVCYSGNVLDLNERIKISDEHNEKKSAGKEKETKTKFAFTPTHYETPQVLTRKLNFIRTNPKYSALKSGWEESCKEYLYRKFDEIGLDFDYQSNEYRATPISKNGKIACASVSASEEYNAEIKKTDRKLLALETEASGLFEAIDECGNRQPCLIIRGISDFADSDKNNLESRTKDIFRYIAAKNAALFLMYQFKNEEVVGFVREQRGEHFKKASGDLLPLEQPKDSLSEIYNNIDIEIENRLNELSPEYKAKPKGYELPVPRVRTLLNGQQDIEDDDRKDYEPEELINQSDLSVIDIPRSYPDKSLPWVIAKQLTVSEFEGRSVVPLVIDGGNIRPPSAGLVKSCSMFDLSKVNGLSEFQIVFIIDGIDLTSKTRMEFLKKELDSYPTAKTIVFSHGQGNMIFDNPFVLELGGQVFEICDVSFLSISNFINKNFGVEMGEAEVMAYRLSNTFEDFDLYAHPTYFAGISRDTLYSLVRANRRVELIELAVAGFLTFLVAEDKADISLSRTTREKFLQEIAYEICVEKKAYNKAELVEYTQEYADKNDFNIEPLQFLTAFVDKGILNFDKITENVDFSLPFVRTYLLGQYLSRRPAIAKRYFDFSDQIDMQTFDLYCEIGLDDAIKKTVIDRLKSHLPDDSLPQVQNIFLSDKLDPEFLKKVQDKGKIQDKIARKIKALKNSDSDGESKQRMLDVNRRISERAHKESSKSFSEKDEGDSYTTLAQDWVLGGMMLSAGAEDLPAVEKREIATLLIKLADVLIERMTSKRVSVDFHKVRADLLDSEYAKRWLKAAEDEAEREGITSFMNLSIDISEIQFLSTPLIGILNHMCEQVGRKVLARSINVEEDEPEMQKILRHVWLADLDSQLGKKPLQAIMKKAPRANFLRLMLATLLINRVYWSHSNRRDRDTLLDLTNEIIKPIGRAFDKKKVIKTIEANVTAKPYE